jgi:hypothetical protein
MCVVCCLDLGQQAANVSTTPRRDIRHKVRIKARLRVDASENAGCVLDVSRHGMQISCATPPEHGSFVEVVGHDLGLKHGVVGHVEWTGDQRFGLTLYDPLDVDRLLGGEEAPRPTTAQRVGRRNPMPVAHQADAARSWGRRLEYAFMVLAGAAGALLVAYNVRQQLSSFTQVTHALEQANAQMSGVQPGS